MPFFFFFPYIFISWRLTLQYCSGFCYMPFWKQFSHVSSMVFFGLNHLRDVFCLICSVFKFQLLMTLKNWETSFKNFFFLVKIYWLCWVLIVACGILSCSIWDLVPWRGIEPRLPALGHGVLASGPPGKSQIGKFLSEVHGFLYFGRKAWKSC